MNCSNLLTRGIQIKTGPASSCSIRIARTRRPKSDIWVTDLLSEFKVNSFWLSMLQSFFFCVVNKTTKNNNKTPPNTKAPQKSISMINTERILNSYGLVKGLEKWHGLYGKQYGRFPQMLTESYLPYNPVYYLVYTQEVGTIVAVCTPTYVYK